MLKVLICDDERNICHLIVRLIQWEQLDLTLVGTALNGKDALEMILEKAPDIVLTDIRMPVYNGLELAARARQLGVDARFIVISGYDNFSYAQDALKASVSDYLLKPINGQELNAALARLSEQIRQEREKRTLMDSIENRLQAMSDVELSIFMKNVILGNAAAYSSHMLQACGLNFSENRYCSLLVIFDREGVDGDSAVLPEHLLRKLQDTLTTANYPCLRELVSYSEGNRLYAVYNYAEGQGGVVRCYLEDMYYACRRVCAMLPLLHVTLAVGSAADSPARLSESMAHARDALHTRCNLGVDRILFYDDLPPEFLHRPRLESSVIARLRSCLELCDAEALETILQGLFQDSGDGVSYYSLSQELLSLIQKEQASALLNSDYTVDEPGLYDQTCAALENAWTPEQLYASLLDFSRTLFSIADRRGAPKSDQSIELAKKYIAENYAGECSLQDVANYAHLSANYLSSTFKKKVGISMNTYITVVRINEAKRLLKDSDEGIYDVGERVGYHDPKHFRKVFKENVGISPAKYRGLYR